MPILMCVLPAGGGGLIGPRAGCHTLAGTVDLRWRLKNVPVQGGVRLRARRRPAGGHRRARPTGIASGERFQTLLGITGSGKSATIAWTIEQVQRPTLVLAPNKSLAAQLANEFREFFPENRVEYFVSYYDYYQPEAYIPSTDTYIEKDSSINDEIDRLRHSATAALLTRRDVIVVASVSCIYGLGSPEEYRDKLLIARAGRGASTSGRSCAGSSTCSTSATT